MRTRLPSTPAIASRVLVPPMSPTSKRFTCAGITSIRLQISAVQVQRMAPELIVAIEQPVGAARPPTARRVIVYEIALHRPYLEDRVDHAPRRFHFVDAQKQRMVALDHVQQQALVSVELFVTLAVVGGV